MQHQSNRDKMAPQLQADEKPTETKSIETIKSLQIIVDKYSKLATATVPFVAGTAWPLMLKTFNGLNQLERFANLTPHDKIDANQLRIQFNKWFGDYDVGDCTGGSNIWSNIYQIISGFLAAGGPYVKLADLHRILQDGKIAVLDGFVNIQIILSVMVVVVQTNHLVSIWNELKKAENLIKEANKETNKAQQNIAKLKSEINDIDAKITKYIKCLKDGEEMEMVGTDQLKVIFRRMKALHALYEETVELIGDLQFKINGSICKLDAHLADKNRSRCMHIGAIVGHIGIFAIPLFTVATFTTPFVVLNLSLIAMHSVLYYNGSKSYKITKKRLKELGTVFGELKQMSSTLDEIDKDIYRLEDLYLQI